MSCLCDQTAIFSSLLDLIGLLSLQATTPRRGRRSGDPAAAVGWCGGGGVHRLTFAHLRSGFRRVEMASPTALNDQSPPWEHHLVVVRRHLTACGAQSGMASRLPPYLVDFPLCVSFFDRARHKT